MSSSIDKRSPLKDSPLRHPGQSLDEQIDRLVNDDAAIYLLVALVLVLLAVLEWVRLYLGSPQLHWPYTAMAAAAVVGAIWRRSVVRRKLRNVRLGREGERAVGQFLERMRGRGFRVFHDIKVEKGNIDHVLVGPEGVYTIETKTRSFPQYGTPKVIYDGEQVMVDGWKPDRDCVAQSKSQAYQLHQLIVASANRKVWVQPIVVFPGWIIDGSPEDIKATVWVLEPKSLPGLIAKQRNVLSAEDIKSISSCVSNHSRTAST
jgi:hypothetical protein